MIKKEGVMTLKFAVPVSVAITVFTIFFWNISDELYSAIKPIENAFVYRKHREKNKFIQSSKEKYSLLENITESTATKNATNHTKPIASLKSSNLPHTRPLILEWIATPHVQDWVLPNIEFCGGGCDITRNRSMNEKSDALVFYMQGTNIKDIPDPSKRSPDQIYLWWDHESPHTVGYFYHHKLTEFNNFFNMTMHYRSDSDVIANFIPYTALDWYLHRIGRSKESDVKNQKRYTTDKEFDILFEKLMKRKIKSTAWLVTDCTTVPGAITRRKFVERMKSEGNFKIDIFGACGSPLHTKNENEVFHVIQSYKFYLAFENSRHCKDYVTEKFWYNSLYAGTVPVVLGAHKSDVEKVAPPHSFIHVEDFDYHPKKLTDYLGMLDKNITAYKEYFRWWTMPGFYPIHNLREDLDEHRPLVATTYFDHEVAGFCHLCRILNNKRSKMPKKVVPNLAEAFFGKDNPECIFKTKPP